MRQERGYGQFCPVAKGAEMFAERWTPLVIRELLCGSHRFNEIRRGVPKMSSSVLSQRLKELEWAGVVERHRAKGERSWGYFLTDAGEALRPLVETLGAWGHEYMRSQMGDNELDEGLLMWDIRRGVKVEQMPAGRVVIFFEFQLHPVGPEVLAGLIVFPYEQAKEVLTKYREFAEDMLDDLNVWAVLRQAPPLPFLPEAVHGQEIVILAMCYAGDVQEGEKAIEPLRGFGQAHGEHIGAMPYTAWQQAFDPLLTPGARNYWKSHNFSELSDGALDAIIDYAGRLPSSQCEIFIGLLGGQASRVEPTATAYAHRDTKFILNVHTRWEQPAEDEKCISWAREFFQTTAPHATGSVYVNFLTEEETDRVHAAYGPNYERMVGIKSEYDPTNLFCQNQNIQPKT